MLVFGGLYPLDPTSYILPPIKVYSDPLPKDVAVLVVTLTVAGWRVDPRYPILFLEDVKRYCKTPKTLPV